MTERAGNGTATGAREPVWRPDDVVVVCEDCDWRFAVAPSSAPSACPHCAGDRLVRVSSDDCVGLEHPAEMAVPVAASEADLDDALTKFASFPFKPADLTLENLRARLQVAHVPVWLVDASARADWQAEVGFDYKVVSHEDSFTRGRWQSTEVEETRVRWEPRAGRLVRRYDNMEVAALETHRELWETLGGWDRRDSVPAASVDLRQGAVVLPTRAKDDAWPEAVPLVQQSAAEDCRAAAGADHVRRFSWTAGYSDHEWTLQLLPMLSTYYTDDDGRRMAVLINGQSGLLTGWRLHSMRRALRWTLPLAVIALIALAASLAMYAVDYAQGSRWAFGFAVLVGLFAIMPVFYVWATYQSTAYRSRP